MSRTEERYNILDTEARWQAAWRCGTVSPPGDGEARVMVAPGPAGLTVDQARGCVLADVLVRMWRARGIAVTLHLPADAVRLGVIGSRITVEPQTENASESRVLVDCRGIPAPPRLRVGRVLGPVPHDTFAAVGTYGADSLRLYLLCDTPPNRDLTWCDGGIEGAWRFCHRLWRLVVTTVPAVPAPAPTAAPANPSAAVRSLLRRVAETAAAVTADLDQLCIHKAIARLRLLSHTLAALPRHESGAPWALRHGLESLLRQFAPILPHLCEELWHRLGHTRPLSNLPWPTSAWSTPDGQVGEDTVTIAVHVNGTRRGQLHLPRDADREETQRAALALPAVAHHTRGLPPRQVIVVPNRILNVVL